MTKRSRLQEVVQLIATKNFLGFAVMMYLSGKLTEYLVKKYVFENADQLPKMSQKNNEKYQDNNGQNQAVLGSKDFTEARRLKPQDLYNKEYFGRNRNFFIQLVDDVNIPFEKLQNDLSPQYYTLKRLVRKKNQPLYAHRIYLSDFMQQEGDFQKCLSRVLNIESPEDFSQIDYILVNEDKLKIPVYKGDEATQAVGYKFLMNPTTINNLDDLFDAFEVNKGTNVKYVIICNPKNWKSPKDMTIQQKLFRKFFYENSAFIDSEVKFIEISNIRVAQRLGIENDESIYVFQNKNPFSELESSEKIKFQSLDLERLKCSSLDKKQIEVRYRDILPSFTRREFEQYLLTEQLDEVFESLTKFIEDILTTENKGGLIFVQTSQMLKFYKNFLQSKQKKFVFVSDTVENIQSLAEKYKQSKEKSQIPIIMTDVNDAGTYFNLLCNDNKCLRYIDYSHLFNEKLNKIIKLDSISEDENLRKECDRDYASIFTLKSTLEDLSAAEIQKILQGDIKPYLESDQANQIQEFGIPTLNRENYKQLLASKDITIIEVFANKCPACRKIDTIMPTLRDQLESKSTQITRINVFNEVSFLKDIDKTPCFLVYNKKKGSFILVDSKVNEVVDYENNQELAEHLIKKIQDTIKSL
eukprot:403370913